MKRDKLFFAICCIVMAGMPLTGSAQTDSTDNGNSSFNANNYLMQKRYIPKGRGIDRNAKGKNFSLGIFGGVEKQQGQGATVPLIKNFGISLTKDLNEFNSYRLSFNGGVNDYFTKLGMEVDHIFKIQDYLTGWNPDRNFLIETVWGLGLYGTLPKEGENKIAGGIHGGLIFSRRLNKNIDIFAEPRLNLYTDGIDGYNSERKYDIGGQVMFGLKYRFTGYEFNGMSNKDPMDNFFYEIYAGTNGDFSDRTWSYHKMKTLGPNGGIALGKWFYPLGFKFTGFGGWRNVPGPKRNVTSQEPYGGVRVEGMVNLNTLFFTYETEPKFELNLLGGYEIGGLAHKGNEYSRRYNMFHGPTASLQALYFVKPQFGLFAQARWSKNIYDQPMVSGTVENRIMRNMGLEIGVQYRRRYEKAEETKGKYAFEPYNFVSAQIGTNFPFQTSSLNVNDLGQQFSISYGRRYSRVAAVRGTIESARYCNSKTTYPLTFAVDLMLDAFAATGAYNPERIVNLYPYAGLLFTHNEVCDENNFGIRGGADLVFKVSDKWDVFLEGDIRMYKGKIAPDVRVFTSARVSFVTNAAAGLTYRF